MTSLATMGKPDDSEADRLRRELWVVNSERLRLRAELDEMRGYGLGMVLDWLRVGRSLRARIGRRLRRGRIAIPVRGPAPGRAGLAPRLTGSEFAALAKRRVGVGAKPHRVGAPAGDGRAWLVPVLVDSFGRDGSTAMMARLASSPDIVVDDKYPFERRYFTYLWRWSRLLERTDWPSALWGKEDIAGLSQERMVALLGPPPWFPRELLAGADGRGMSAACFEFAWRELSARAIADHAAPAPRYYAEKNANTWDLDRAELPEHRLIAMLRDPRDVQASIESFERVRPEVDFAGNVSRAGLDRLSALVERHRRRLRWVARLMEDESALVVRFDQLTNDPEEAARRVGEYLEIPAPGRHEDQQALERRHVTATEAPVGRWKRDLDPRTAERLTRELAPELEAVGFSAD